MSNWIDLLTRGLATEFKIEGGDFSALEIRPSDNNPSFHYFYDAQKRRLITDFILHEGPKVSTLCTVTLIHDGTSYSPRLKFWKKDRRRGQNNTAIDHRTADEPPFHMIKAAVDIRDGHENLWRLINFLRTCQDVTVPQEVFRVVGHERAQLVEILHGSDKEVLVAALSTALAGKVTQEDLNMIANRKGQLDRFHKLLNDGEFLAAEQARIEKTRIEDLWQAFFEENPWIFGYGLNLIACTSYDDKKLERITTGASLFGGAGKRSDAVLRSRGVLSSLLFCEIKRHDTPLLDRTAYRPPDVFQPAKEIVGAVAQVQKTADKAVRSVHDYIHRQFDPDGTPSGFEVSTVRPRQVVVAGRTSEFEVGGTFNPEQVSSFEFYRRGITDVEIITFDELYERARFIVSDSDINSSRS